MPITLVGTIIKNGLIANNIKYIISENGPFFVITFEISFIANLINSSRFFTKTKTEIPISNIKHKNFILLTKLFFFIFTTFFYVIIFISLLYKLFENYDFITPDLLMVLSNKMKCQVKV